MSDFIPKPPSTPAGTPRIGGLGPKAQRLQALREKAAQQAAGSARHHADSAAPAAKSKNNPARKTQFNRKAV